VKRKAPVITLPPPAPGSGTVLIRIGGQVIRVNVAVTAEDITGHAPEAVPIKRPTK
jgi:hypothetical protein